MKSIFTVGLLIIFASSSAQFLQDVTGQPYLQKTSTEYQGTPFLFPEWVKANVTVSSGKSYQNIFVNIDLEQGLPIFLNEDKILTFSEKLNEIVLVDSALKRSFKRGSLININLPDVLLEIVNDAPVLLKQNEKDLVEVPTYGSSNKTYRYAESSTYYALLENDYKKISLTKETARKVFANHWNDIEFFAKKNNVSYKTDEGWRSLFQFYRVLDK